MKNLDQRLRDLEQRAEAIRQRDDPRAKIRLALELAMMHATVPCGPDGSPERQRELDRVARLQQAYERGDASEAQADIDAMFTN